MILKENTLLKTVSTKTEHFNLFDGWISCRAVVLDCISFSLMQLCASLWALEPLTKEHVFQHKLRRRTERNDTKKPLALIYVATFQREWWKKFFWQKPTELQKRTGFGLSHPRIAGHLLCSFKQQLVTKTTCIAFPVLIANVSVANFLT